MQPIEKLIAGFQRFRSRHFVEAPVLYERLAQEGQSPKVMVIACCDSRVDPAIITDCDPGDLFVVRNVANLVPPCERDGSYHGTSAALEFAVTSLQVEHIIVLGHGSCGGVRALLTGADQSQGESTFIANWMGIARQARDQALGDGQPLENEQFVSAEQHVVRISLRNLMTFPFVSQRVQQGRLHLHGWYFDLRGGQLLACDPDSPRVTSLVEDDFPAVSETSNS